MRCYALTQLGIGALTIRFAATQPVLLIMFHAAVPEVEIRDQRATISAAGAGRLSDLCGTLRWIATLIACAAARGKEQHQANRNANRVIRPLIAGNPSEPHRIRWRRWVGC